MDEFFDRLGEELVFSTLDDSLRYPQIQIDDRDRDKTAFTSHHGLYRLIGMPFRLQNAPATFQRAADVILDSVR